MNLERLTFIKEEVIVSEVTSTEKPKDPFASSALPQDKSDLVLYEVVKVGNKQTEIKVGNRLLISAQIPQEIKIRGFEILENIKKLNNSDPIFSIVDA